MVKYQLSKNKKIEFHIFQTKIIISFAFVACICLMFLLDNGYNALMSLVSISIHELSHIICILLFGGKLKLMQFSLLEMNIKADEDRLSTFQKFVVAVAGPVSNLILFAIFFGKYKDFAMVNLVIACFQLLPINSLDGDKALEMVGISNKTRQRLSFILAFVFAFIGFYILIKTKYNFSVLIISLYLLFNSFACKKL